MQTLLLSINCALAILGLAGAGVLTLATAGYASILLRGGADDALRDRFYGLVGIVLTGLVAAGFLLVLARTWALP